MEYALLLIRPTCPYCQKAQRLLAERNIPFQAIEVTHWDPRHQAQMVPVVFVGAQSSTLQYLGGCDALERQLRPLPTKQTGLAQRCINNVCGAPWRSGRR